VLTLAITTLLRRESCCVAKFFEDVAQKRKLPVKCGAVIFRIKLCISDSLLVVVSFT